MALTWLCTRRCRWVRPKSLPRLLASMLTTFFRLETLRKVVGSVVPMAKPVAALGPVASNDQSTRMPASAQCLADGLVQPFAGGFGDKLVAVGGDRVLQTHVIGTYGVKALQCRLDCVELASIKQHAGAVVAGQFGQKACFRGLEEQVVLPQICAVGGGCSALCKPVWDWREAQK